MLREYLEKLCEELSIDPTPKLNEEKTFLLPIGNESVQLKDLEPGLSLQGQITPCPKKKKEEIFMYLSRANLLGQAAGAARIGIDAQDQFLTLSLGLPYEMNYQTFKETIEDFVNYLIYWRDAVMKLENEKSVY